MRGELRLKFSRCYGLAFINYAVALLAAASLFYLPLPYWAIGCTAITLFFFCRYHLAQFCPGGELGVDVSDQVWYLDGKPVVLNRVTLWPWLVALRFSDAVGKPHRLVLWGNCDPQALRRLRVVLNLAGLPGAMGAKGL